MRQRVGVDIGGSFTDFAIVDEATREVRALKVFSRPDKPGAEVIDGIEAAGARYGIRGEDISYFTHGTTVGVNTVIQRKGIRLALFATENFCDVLELGRLKLPAMFDLLSKRPEPLIGRDMVFGVAGRLRADGSEATPLDAAGVETALSAAQAAGAEGIVISFLHSYRSDRHEMAAKRIVERLAPGLPVFASAEIWPIIREFERTTTAAIGSYVQPRVAHYFSSLQAALKEAGVEVEARVAKSNGGVMSVEQGKAEPVQTILSGTASGVIGAAFVARLCGLGECMSLDVGGTSADVALIVDGEPQYGIGEYIGDHQIHIPSVSVTSIGEGGGSIAWVDALGVLKVGPESAGSTPGPACFGRGGTRATITDAFAVCGVVGQSADFGYSAVKVDVDAARAAVGEVAARLGMGVEEAAEAIIKVAVSGMFVKVTGLVTRFGVDPRSTAMLPFGGAGPMMGCLLAREMEMPETVVPTVPGVLSALGGLIAELKNDFIRTVYMTLDDAALPEISAIFADLRAAGEAWLRGDQGYEGDMRVTLSADMRYPGQSFEVEGVFDPDALAAGDVAALSEAFHAAHEKLYGHANRDEAVQIVNLRLVVSGSQPTPVLPLIETAEGAPEPVRMARCWVDGGWRDVALFRRADLRAGHAFDGPAIVAQDDATVYMPPATRARVDAYGHLRITQTGDL